MRIWIMLLAAFVASAHAQQKMEMVERVDRLGTLLREPMVVQHPSGTLFIGGFGSQILGTDWTAPPLLLRSEDGGQSWTSVNVGSSDDGAQGNSDVDLAIGPDGTIYFVSMGFNREIKSGVHIAIGVSHDVGKNWSWQFLSRTARSDRPWVAVTSDNTAHVVWNDGAGVRHAISNDSGRNWRQSGPVSEQGGSSHLAAGAGGRLAVRVTPLSASGQVFKENFDHVALSRDNGQSWILSEPPARMHWDPSLSQGGSLPRWVEPVAWGQDNTLYAFWSEGESVWLGWTEDEAQTWQKHQVAEENGVAYYPFLVAGDAGALAATWFVWVEDRLEARVAHLKRDEDGLQVRMSPAFIPQTWVDTREFRQPDSAGEYLPVVFLQNGDLGVAAPIQDAQHGRYGFSWMRFQLVGQ